MSLTACRRFFEQPSHPRQRMYEALRAYFLEGRPSPEVARAFGYRPGSFGVLCHEFRRDSAPKFFASPQPGPPAQPKKAQELIVALRKQNHSVYEIAQALKEQQIALSPRAVREVLREEGFAPLPPRLDEERPARLRPTVEPLADVGEFTLEGRHFWTRCGGLFLFVPDRVWLEVDSLGKSARLPGSAMSPAGHALRAALALKHWSIERKSPIMALVADEGLGLFRDALSSALGLKVDFDMALLVIASGLYRLLARRMRDYANAQARHIFRDLMDTPADLTACGREARVHFHRRAHLPIILASDLLDSPIVVPCWGGFSLRMTA